MNGNPASYSKYDQVPKPKFNREIGPEAIEAIGMSYEILPLFESAMFRHAFIEHYSVIRNPFYASKWKVYKQGIADRVFAPFQLPDVRELHFHNGAIRFVPTASFRHKDNRRKLKSGPVVDHYGQIPIPYEAFIKRGVTKTDKNEKLVKKTKRTNQRKGKNAVKEVVE